MSAPAVTVLFVTAATERGGAEAVLRALLVHLDRSRVHPVVCCLRSGPFETELRRIEGLDVVTAPVRGFRHAGAGWRAVRRLRGLIGERGVAVVHANGIAAHVYAGMAARLEGVPAIFHLHDVLAGGWSGQGLVNAVARRVPAAAIVTPSRFLADRVGPTRSRVVVIPNGVEEPPADTAPPDAVRDGTARTVVWCGRLQRWKGAHVFLDAAAHVHRRRPDARFVVVGGPLFGLEPDYAAGLERLAARDGLGGAVRFTGHLADAWPELRRADVVVHSAVRPEPFGLVVIEAMLAGRAVVAAAAGGPTEIVEDGVTGLLTPPGDAGALAQAIEHLLDDDARRASMGRAGRARARELFGADRMARRFEALYQDIAGMTSRTRERRDVA